ncbi:MAG: ABC transporter permease [Chloroflexi bacterium]|nr:ABC transporter permease [Chloroflexota bacterium]
MKKWFQLLSGAWVGLVSHKLRSFLTILGVVIGVSAVIALMSVGKGASASIISNIESLGSNLLFVRPGTPTDAGVRGAVGTSVTLTREDAEAIAEQVSYAAVAVPVSSASMQLITGGQNLRAQVTGVTPDYQWAYNLQVAEGSFIGDNEYQRNMKVAVLGANVRNTLFGDNDPVGQTIRMGNNVIRVIGVLASKGASMLGASDDAIYIPLTTLQQLVNRPLTSRGEHVVNQIVIAVYDKEDIDAVTQDVKSVLQYRHQIPIGGDDDFAISSIQDLIGTISQAMNTMTLLLGAIAAISLLVGGIGVMNIMLVSVIERTREIGIRKALGAREHDIWGQFLIEAAFLTFVGGIIGILVGWGISLAVTRFYSLTTLVSADIVLLAVSVSVGIGLFFGFYPAWHASRLNPIEALRAE